MARDEDPFGGGAGAGARAAGSVVDGLVLVAIVVLSFAAVAFTLVRAEHHALHDPDEKAARGELVGAAGDSLLEPGRLAEAIHAVVDRSADGTVFLNVRLAPTSLSIEVREPSSKRFIVRVTPSLDVDRSEFGQGDDRGFGPGSLDVQAPRRFIAAVAEGFRYPPKELDYIVYNVSSDGVASLVGFWKRDGVSHTFNADGRGRHVTSQDAEREAATRRDPAAIAAAKRAACIERAQSPEDIERCGAAG